MVRVSRPKTAHSGNLKPWCFSKAGISFLRGIRYTKIGVSQKWMVKIMEKWKTLLNGWFRGTIIFGNTHIFILECCFARLQVVVWHTLQCELWHFPTRGTLTLFGQSTWHGIVQNKGLHKPTHGDCAIYFHPGGPTIITCETLWTKDDELGLRPAGQPFLNTHCVKSFWFQISLIGSMHGIFIYLRIYHQNINQSCRSIYLSSHGSYGWFSTSSSFVFTEVLNLVSHTTSHAYDTSTECLCQFEFRVPSLKLTFLAPENGWLEDYFPFGEAYFQVLC